MVAADLLQEYPTEQWQFEFTVALVPDPRASQLANQFDQALAAIESAYNEASYLLVQHWHPWGDELEKRKLYQTQPGVLLFLGPSAAVRSLGSVFLVGETPKTGLHRAAFSRALEWIARLQPTGDLVIRIIGPSFSGSTPSLHSALKAAQEGQTRRVAFQVVTGSATAAGIGEELRAGLEGSVEFCRLVVPDHLTQKKAYDFLAERFAWDLRHAALLQERDTAYGLLFDEPDSTMIRARVPGALPGLRAAWQGVEESRRSPLGGWIGVHPSALPLPLAEPIRSIDVIPESSSATAASNDLAISNLLTALSRQGIRYLGILTTDARDKLFLARRMRELTPDVILFTFDNNLLYAHPEFSEQMDDALVISSFPLLTEHHDLATADGGHVRLRRQFTNEFQQGVYWATLALLPTAGSMRPQKPAVWIAAVGNGTLWPVARLPLDDPPEEMACSFLGKGSSRADTENPFGKLADRANLQMLVFLLMLALLASWVRRMALPQPDDTETLREWARRRWRLLIWWHRERAQRAASQPIPIPWIAKLRAYGERRGDRPCEPELPASTSCLLCLALLTLLVMGLVLLVVGTVPLGNHLTDGRFGLAWRSLGRHRLYTSLMFAAYLGLLWIATRSFRLQARRWRRRAGIGLACIFVSLLLFGAAAWVLDRLWMPGGYVLFPPRARKFSSGLSPLVSLAWLLAALFSWCVFEIHRETVRRRYRVPWPAPKGKEEPPLALEDDPKRPWGDTDLPAVERLIRKSPPRNFWILFGCLFVPPVLFVLSRTIQPIAESKAYGRIFLLAAAAVFGLSATSFYRFLGLWRIAAKILEWLDHTRLEDALSRCSAEVAWNPMKAFGWQLPKLRMAHLSWDKLSEIRRRGPSVAVIAEMTDQLDVVFKEERSDSLKARKALNKIFQQADRELVAFRGDPGVDDYHAVRTVAYIRHLFAHIHTSLACAMTMLILLLIAVRTYAFEPKQFVSVGLLAAILGAIVITFWTFLEMDRNPILCRISNTPPGRVTLDRYLLANVFTYVALPLAGVIITQFPEVGKYFVGWLNPLLRIVGAG